MKRGWLYQIALVTSLAGLAYTDVLDLGDLEQYKPKQDTLPDGVQADAIWVGRDNGGVRVVLGQDIRARVDGVLGGCGSEINDQCFQELNKVLEDTYVQTDGGLERREAAGLGLWTTIQRFKEAVGWVIGAFAGKGLPQNQMGQSWSEPAASNAGKLSEASPITLSAGGDAVATITQAPATLSLRGDTAPAVTVVTTAADGFENGDLAAVAAINRINEYHRTFAPFMGIPRDLVDQLTNYIYALALDRIVDNVPLSGKNRIKASLVSTSTSASPSSTSTGCPEPTSLFCDAPGEEDCPAKLTDGPDRKVVCAEGQHRDCECDPLRYTIVEWEDLAHIKQIMSLQALLDAANHEAKPTCSTQATNLPADIFSSDAMNAHTQFCDRWFPQLERAQTVNALGENTRPNTHLKRAPPPNRNTYRDWTFYLHYKPSAASLSPSFERRPPCVQDCNQAFAQLASSCSATNLLLDSGTYDVGCGVFSFRVHRPAPPTTERKEFPRHCYKRDGFGRLHGDIKADRVREFAWDACLPSTGPIIRKGDPGTFIQYFRDDKKAPYQFNVWWEEGCTLAAAGPTEVHVNDPLDTRPKGRPCVDYLRANWKECNNAGFGGSIKVGCLVYEFKADRNLRRW
ncbi:hypothetical protein QBC37DRAFT_372294 [Rhypophila decipiens]|uniref:Uncharacterized protein n=1 Tax=Rhypophila decipiens TaxID=261697 RepID=A0AAN7B726_9PEZI|nr:hypothetical protein QBC37DRAFT_372294 [Rhypophila decipiens]